MDVLVRVLTLRKGAPNDRILVGISNLRPHVPLTNRWKYRQALQLLDAVIHLALEFAIRRHLTVEISASAHLHPRVPRVPRAVIHEYTKNSYLKLRPRHQMLRNYARISKLCHRVPLTNRWKCRQTLQTV